MRKTPSGAPSFSRRAGSWQPVLAVVVVVISITWAGARYRMVWTQAQRLAAEVAVHQVGLAQDGERLRAFREGFVGRSPDAFSDSLFLSGVELSAAAVPAQSIDWDIPVDGDYLLVAQDCPWSRQVVDVALVQSDSMPLIILDYDSNFLQLWRDRVDEPSRPVRVVAPRSGWWNVGMPAGVTPVWFTVRNQRLVDIGIGQRYARD